MSPIDIYDLEGSRFEAAMELFKEGDSFSFNEATFSITPKGEVEIAVHSTWWLENMTVEKAKIDFKHGREVFEYLCSESSRFLKLVEGRQVKLIIIVDYGKGSYKLCSLINGKIQWVAGFPIIK